MADENNALLNTRGSTHGEYSNNSHDTWRLMRIVMESRNWEAMPDQMRHALYMVLHKVARAIDGNIFIKDHWDDMAGYATLVSNRINAEQTGLRPEHVRGQPELVDDWDRPDFYTKLAKDFGLSRDHAKDVALSTLAKAAKVEEVATTGPVTGASAPATAQQLEPRVPGTPEDGGHHEGGRMATVESDLELAGWSFDLVTLAQEMSFVRKPESKAKIVHLLKVEGGRYIDSVFRSQIDFGSFSDGSKVPDEYLEEVKKAMKGVVAWRRPICRSCKLPSSEPCPRVGNSEALQCAQYRGNTPENPGKK